MLQLAAKKPFPVFCTMLLAQNVGEFKEDKIRRWVRYYALIFNNKEKIIKVDSVADDYEEFMAFYIFYLCVQKKRNITIIENGASSISYITKVDDYFHSIFREDYIKDDSLLSMNKISFTNDSQLTSIKTSTYNIRNLEEINFIYFDKTVIKNPDKLLYDIELFYSRDDLEKMVLSMKNDLTKDFPELKIVEIK